MLLFSGSTGALTSLTKAATAEVTVDWASEEHPIGQFVYQVCPGVQPELSIEAMIAVGT